MRSTQEQSKENESSIKAAIIQRNGQIIAAVIIAAGPFLLSIISDKFDAFLSSISNDKYKIILIVFWVLLLISFFIYNIYSFIIRRKNVRELPELVKNKGIIGIIDNKDNNYTPVSNKLKDAKKSLKIIAYFGEMVLNNQCSVLIDNLNLITENLKEPFIVKLLTSRNDPNSETPENSVLIKEVQELEGPPYAHAPEKQKDVEYYIKLLKDGINIKDNIKIEVGYYNTQVRYAVTIIDDEWAWWTPYHTGKRTEKLISLILKDKKDGSFFQLCNEHFNAIWKKLEKEGKIVKY